MYATQLVARRGYPRLVVLSAALALAACSDPTVLVPAVGDSPEVSTAQYSKDADMIAHALARAMSNDAIRHAVRDAMRYSLVDGHKLVLQEFVQSPEAAALVASASEFAGLTAPQFQQRVAALPSLDFYMPLRTHRRAWQGDSRIAVMAALGDDANNLTAYTADGDALSANGKSVSNLPPFFVIQLAETKGLRVRPQAATRGNVIEEAGDGLGSERFLFRRPSGETIVIDFATTTPEERRRLFERIARRDVYCDDSAYAFVPCEQPTSGGPPPQQPSNVTKVGEFQHWNCDNGHCWEDAEFRFNADYYTAGGTFLGHGQYSKGSLEPGVTYVLNVPIIYQSIANGSGEYMYVQLIEEDRGDWFGTNNDDNCGAVLVTQGRNGGLQTYPNISGCAGGVDEGFLFGNVAEAQYFWQPR